MGEDEPRTDALRDIIDSFGREHAPEVAARAEAEAIARATAVLAEEMAKSILDHVPEREAAAPRTERPPSARDESPAPPPSARDESHAPPPAARGASRSPSPHPPRPSEERQGVWVYGVVRGGGSELRKALEGLTGVAPGTVPDLLEDEGLAAIVSSVPLVEFGEEPLRENLNDVEWLERVARCHEAVLEAAIAVETVVPLRICTIYESVDHLREGLGERRGMFVEALRHLEGRTELGVKLVAEPGALDRALSNDAGGVGEQDVSPGVAYLRGKEREARARDDADRVAEEWIDAVHEPLASIAVEALLNPLQNPELSGYAGEMLLNGVYLVEDDRRAEFIGEAERLRTDFAERDATVELTGPWPPYNFVNGSIEAAR